jgi:hypothetical protein
MKYIKMAQIYEDSKKMKWLKNNDIEKYTSKSKESTRKRAS